MPSIPRIVYFAQKATVVTAAGKTYTLPVSTASIEVTRPVEAITSFGKFGSLNVAQTNLTTCKSSLKCYLGTGTSLGYQGEKGITSAVLNDMISSTTSSSGMTISVSPGGFTMSGILTNIGIDISMGGFGMCDFGFAGIGNPVLVSPNAGNQTTENDSTLSISPITTMSIGSASGALNGVYATSIKFSYDMPTDTLAALGDNPNASQGSSQLVSSIATKPPYKTTISVEGHGVDPTLLDTGVAGLGYGIGNIAIVLPNAKVSARSFNNAAGQVSATYSYTAEDVSATILGADLTAYGNPPAAVPAWGA